MSLFNKLTERAHHTYDRNRYNEVTRGNTYQRAIENKYDSTTTKKEDRKLATSKPASQRRQDLHRRRQTWKIIRVNSNF